MSTYAIIQNGQVVNVVDYPTDPGSPPPGFPAGTTAVLNAGASIGWSYSNGAFTNPDPPAPPTPQQQATQALAQAQQVALQCLMYGVTYPATWQAYATSLAAVAAGTATTLPVQPAMPALPTTTPVTVSKA